jgi:molybdenum cofactor cytidylyltransferase
MNSDNLEFNKTPLMFDALILAAGKSSRFGSNKIVYNYNGTIPLIEMVYSLYEKSGNISNIIVVAGYEKYLDEIFAFVKNKPKLEFAVNTDYENGMYSSIKKGVEYVSDNSAGFFVHPCDCPVDNMWITRKMIEKFRKNSIVIPSYNNKRGHPALFDIKYKPEILQKNDDFNLRKFYQIYNNKILYYLSPDSSVLRDIDTVDNN